MANDRHEVQTAGHNVRHWRNIYFRRCLWQCTITSLLFCNTESSKIIQGRRNGYSRYSDHSTEFFTSSGFQALIFLTRCYMRSNLWCRRVTRLLSMSSFGKHKHSQNRQDDGISPFRANYQQARGCGMWVWGCDIPSEPVEVGLLVALLPIFSVSLVTLFCDWCFGWKVIRVLGEHLLRHLQNVSEMVFQQAF